MKILALILSVFIYSTALSQDTTQHIVPNRRNAPAQEKKPYVILISADGFRSDITDRLQLPNLLRLRAKGITADHLISSFPSLTFPNHYTIITGMYPAHHGLVDNYFYDKKRNLGYTMGNKARVADGSWYGGTPLWVLAEKQQMLTASFYWVASESDIQGVRPTYYYIYNQLIPLDRRVQVVKEWLQLPEDQRPHFITFYLYNVDHEEHKHGIHSEEAAAAARFIDTAIGKLTSTLDSLQLPINYVFVSDHGMLDVDTLHSIAKPAALDTVAFYVPNALPLLHLYSHDSSQIMPAYLALKKEAVDYDVYLPDETPASWHYRTKDDSFHRVGDILLVAHPPKVFNLKQYKHIDPAEHGYDPSLPAMWATFYAWGPAFKQHKKIKAFENVHIYPLISHILGLPYTEIIDGRFEVLKGTLR